MQTDGNSATFGVYLKDYICHAMLRFLISVLAFIPLLSAAQVVVVPYNPDINQDSVIGTPDLLGLLPLFGEAFAPSPLLIDGQTLDEYIGVLAALSDSLVADSIAIPLVQGVESGEMLIWNGAQWSLLSPGQEGQSLTIVNGVPTWAGLVAGCTDSLACNFDSDASVSLANFCTYPDVCGICGGPGAVYDCGCENIPEGACNCQGAPIGAPECGFPVTFNINTSSISVGSSGLFLGGGLFGGATGHQMFDSDGDGVYTVTVTVPEGYYGHYTFLNGPTFDNDWGTKENIAGQDCADAEHYNDRYLSPVMSPTTINTCFGLCTSDGSCEMSHEVTFTVDASVLPLSGQDVIYVSGTFDGWCGDCHAMQDANGDGVWQVEVNLTEGLHQYKFNINAWTDQEILDAAEACTMANGDLANRFIEVVDAPIVLDTVCWESCYSCDDVGQEAAAVLELKGIIDFSLPEAGSSGKGIHLVAVSDITDLSLYGIGVANNGGGSDGLEFPLPSVSVSAGDDVLLAQDTLAMANYFSDCMNEFEFVIQAGSAISQNGDDAIELYFLNMIIEVYGDPYMDGTGLAWEYTDSWAYKQDEGWITGAVDCTEESVTTEASACPYPLCTDSSESECASLQYLGHNYALVQILDQCWFAENLQAEIYANGDSIPQATPLSFPITGEQMTLATDGEAYVNEYGRLYNGLSVLDDRNLCPAGWKVPTDMDFMELEHALGASWDELNQAPGWSTNIGESANVGGQMKTTGTIDAGDGLWLSPNLGANNSSGFSAKPAGWSNSTYSEQDIEDLGLNGSFWSTTTHQVVPELLIDHAFTAETQGVKRIADDPATWFFSVRCIQCPDGTCEGCTDPGACNYDPTALEDNGTCESLSCFGCTNPAACNFDASATQDDGSCDISSCAGCTDSYACNYDEGATIPDGDACEYETCAGCLASSACNFDPSVTIPELDSCVFPDLGFDCDGNCLPEFLNDEGNCVTDSSCLGITFDGSVVIPELAGSGFEQVTFVASGYPSSLSITSVFINESNGGSFPADMAIGLTDPSGETWSIPGWNLTVSSLGLNPFASELWPSDWNSTLSGTYSADFFNLDPLGSAEPGTWTLTIMNGWSTSNPIDYNLAFSFTGLCIE